jgi:voltage-gated potassium channel
MNRLIKHVPVLAHLRGGGANRLLQYVVIAAGLITMTIITMPGQPAAREAALRLILWGCIAFFLAEWIAQVYRAARNGWLADYLTSGAWLIDALAVLPVPIALILGVPPARAWLFGALWLFKLASLSPGIARLGRVIRIEARPLVSVLVIFLMVLFFAAIALTLIEGVAQPEAFGSLPSALWWAVVTLTTTGYGDAVPATYLGRLVAGVVMICGLGVFGLLTGILATGFVEESRRHNFVQNWDLVKSVPFLRTLDPAGVIEISRMLRRLELPESTTVVRRGREGDCMYFVASGEVEVEVEPHPIRLGPGAFFGEMALLGGGVRNADVTTTLPTTLLVLDLADFRTFTAHHPKLAIEIAAQARKRSKEEKGSRTQPRRAASRRPVRAVRST